MRCTVHTAILRKNEFHKEEYYITSEEVDFSPKDLFRMVLTGKYEAARPPYDEDPRGIAMCIRDSRTSHRWIVVQRDEDEATWGNILRSAYKHYRWQPVG